MTFAALTWASRSTAHLLYSTIWFMRLTSSRCSRSSSSARARTAAAAAAASGVCTASASVSLRRRSCSSCRSHRMGDDCGENCVLNLRC